MPVRRSTPGDETWQQGVRDDGRVLFYHNYTSEMQRSINEDGVDVRGYFAWSLMDNFEWERGYTERFGLVYTDFQTQERHVKASGNWYTAAIAANAVVDPCPFLSDPAARQAGRCLDLATPAAVTAMLLGEGCEAVAAGGGSSTFAVVVIVLVLVMAVLGVGRFIARRQGSGMPRLYRLSDDSPLPPASHGRPAAVMSDELGTDDVQSAPKSPPKQQRVPMSILRSGERLPSNAAPEVADSLDDY